MISLNLEGTPELIIGEDRFYGINIIEKLYSMRETNTAQIENLFQLASSLHLRTRVPRIGFRLKHPKAIMPTKRIIDVGYDITVVDIFKRTTDLTTLYETYVSVEIPLGFYVELLPRSSISKTGYMLANSVGIIDPPYNGTIKVPLIKIDQSSKDLELPITIAQLILKPYVVSDSYDASLTDEITTTRGDGGFGSTG